eukprot:42616-Chlamydomonas_euryale.AAC.2
MCRRHATRQRDSCKATGPAPTRPESALLTVATPDAQIQALHTESVCMPMSRWPRDPLRTAPPVAVSG